jgi:hypothetical protein
MLGKAEADNIVKRKEAIEKYNKAIAKNIELSEKRAPIEKDIKVKKDEIKGKKASNTRKTKKITAIEASKPEATPEIGQYLKNLERQK